MVCILIAVASACIPQSKSDNPGAGSETASPQKVSRISTGLVEVGPATDYNIEHVGDVVQPAPDTVVPFQIAADLDVDGWAVDERNKVSPGGIDVVVDGKHYPATYGIARPDVVTHFKNHGAPGAYIGSGFACKIPGAQIGPGSHVLAIHVITGDAKGYYVTAPVKVLGK